MHTCICRFLKIIFEQFTYTWLRFPVSPTLKGSYNANKASKLHLISENIWLINFVVYISLWLQIGASNELELWAWTLRVSRTWCLIFFWRGGSQHQCMISVIKFFYTRCYLMTVDVEDHYAHRQLLWRIKRVYSSERLHLRIKTYEKCKCMMEPARPPYWNRE